MGVFDDDLILPGTITEIVSDYSYGYDTSLFGTTDSVTIIGTAFNGPVGKPVEIYSPEHAQYIFGETYDSTAKKEATLVAEIQAAWDQGCRTIYAVRVSGKDITKDFLLVPETKLKLRVSGIFPSNKNKNVFMVYDNTVGALTVKIYKPASRATIDEKMAGLVENDEDTLVTTIDVSNSYGLTKDSRLVELINLINNNASNNIIKLSIVDEDGNDVTIASKDAQSLSIGAMFPGAYFIGRDTNYGIATTNMNYAFVNADGSNKPYDSFDEKVFKNLILNSDVNAEYPIYGGLDTLNDKFNNLVVMNGMFDFLAVTGKVDLVFGKNSIDYEEVEITDFDLYQRLGSGFAITAKAELRGESDIRIKETPVSDVNRTASIDDGIYSMLENLSSDYRVVTNGVADAEITGKIPKKAAFKVATPTETDIFAGFVTAKSKIASDNMYAVKQYSFTLTPVAIPDYGSEATVTPSLYTDKVLKRIALVTDITTIQGNAYEEGTLVLAGTAPTFTLYRYTKNSFVALTDAVANADFNGTIFLVGDEAYKVTASGVPESTLTYTAVLSTEFGEKNKVLVQSGKAVAVYEVTAGTEPATDPATFEPMGGLDEIFSDNDDKTLITTQSDYGVVNDIIIKSTALDYTTLEEFVEILNNDADLNDYFEFSVDAAHDADKDSYITDLVIPATPSAAINDKVVGYNTNLYIPYKTTDNFARHLAQHCTYTSLKTAPTHGILGCSKLLNVSLNNIATKVSTAAALDLDLYAKKSNGRNMLDRNNLPYPIGRNISVTVGQYTIPMADYNYIANCASGYAGMISVLALDQSSTNQPIDISTFMYDMTTYQIEKLTQKGFVTFKNSYTKGYVVTDGVTMAPSTSVFRRLSIARITNAIEQAIRTATEPYIGKQNHLANRNAMQTAIKSSLEALKDKLIERYEFKLTVDTSNQKLGIIDIDYVIVPIFEIREVRNRITVKESAS